MIFGQHWETELNLDEDRLKATFQSTEQLNRGPDFCPIYLICSDNYWYDNWNIPLDVCAGGSFQPPPVCLRGKDATLRTKKKQMNIRRQHLIQEWVARQVLECATTKNEDKGTRDETLIRQRWLLFWFFSSRINNVGLALNSIVVFLAHFHQNWYE